MKKVKFRSSEASKSLWAERIHFMLLILLFQYWLWIRFW